MPRRISPPSRCVLAVLGLTLTSWAHALDFGHARLLSGAGQALRAEMALVRLSAQEAADVQVRVAPPDAWRAAGLTPPVDLASLQLRLLPGVSADARTLRITSDQVLSGAVADFLIDVSTPAGALRHQVSLVAPRRTIRLAAGTVAGDTNALRVRRGDTLFAIAEQHAAPGFSVYQMMAALFVDNADAFIDANMNLLKAGAALRLPDAATLARLSDRQARQLFVAHVQALAQRRRGASGVTLAPDADAALSAQALTEEPSAAIGLQAPAEPPQDQLRLRGVGSEAQAAAQADSETATRRALQDRLARIAQLEQNVEALQQVLRELETSGAAPSGQAEASGGAAANAARPGTAAAVPTGAGQADAAPARRDAVQDALRRLEDMQQSARDLDQPETLRRIEQLQESAQGLDQGLRAPAGELAPDAGRESGFAPLTPPSNPAAPSGSPPPATPSQDPQAAPPSAASQSLRPWLAAALILLGVMVVGLWRRTRAADSGAGKISDAMIQEKLKTIDLNLDADAPAPPASTRPA